MNECLYDLKDCLTQEAQILNLFHMFPQKSLYLRLIFETMKDFAFLHVHFFVVLSLVTLSQC